MALSFLRSPCCRAALFSKPEKSQVECSSCGTAYENSEGIILFNQEESRHGEFSSQEMDSILEYAREFGWKRALNDRIQPDKPRVVDLITDPRRGKLLEPLRSGSLTRVLDYGAGYGGVSLHLSSFFKEVVALDEALHRIRFLKIISEQSKVRNISLICHRDTESLPFEDGSFDAVVLTGVLEYLPLSLPNFSTWDAHIKVLKEINRIIKPGGILQIETKNASGWQYWTGAPDHNGIPFASLLPVSLANILSKALRGREYRIVNYDISGYRKLLNSVGWNDCHFRWPYPGYQDPDYIVDLDCNKQEKIKHIDVIMNGSSKKTLVKTLIKFGFLEKFIPYYSITARKSG